MLGNPGEPRCAKGPWFELTSILAVSVRIYEALCDAEDGEGSLNKWRGW
jgi:hypothetical protein